ncbi:tRNA pseudouridine(55) synthase TruB [Culicoidibacter larvae]|uniref:tRNA pseudouridine synthase B n=1 Tax=Culicoidibacter larvae TaxID=2579976 RepID=A0A5R8Q8G9_9FIRM|nr:tRNA pseudouridine(55) synthase TruB [Culicoidibacter larvae]TLG71791.1 tRNA pseudouridine(55) synthase TruB [Culicoidibacter larvae]
MDGVLAVHKPRGMTSHDVVWKLRRILGTKKIGHTGTLDPDVDGVLVVCIGRATKLVQFMEHAHKVYHAEAVLGVATTTEDLSGEVVEMLPVPVGCFDEAMVQQVLADFVGVSKQVPPMYSAVKVNGRKLYEYARNGVEVERPERSIEIFSLVYNADSLKFADERGYFEFDIESAKGLYVRTLCVDIGAKLGFPAAMADLQRTASGQFTLDDCVTLEQIEAGDYVLTAMADIDLGLPEFIVDELLAERIGVGSVFTVDELIDAPNEPFAVLNEHRQLLAVYQPHPEKPGKFKPVRVFS